MFNPRGIVPMAGTQWPNLSSLSGKGSLVTRDVAMGYQVNLYE
jgi:hypothetical protein